MKLSDFKYDELKKRVEEMNIKKMNIKKKLKDLTFEEFAEWARKNCSNISCSSCIFCNVKCVVGNSKCWVNHKGLYSDKFLDQEIEIEIPDILTPDILTKEEKKYLENVIKPVKNKVRSITKKQSENSAISYIHISIDNSDLDCSFDNITLNYSKADTAYANMESNREYKLEELGLFEEEK